MQKFLIISVLLGFSHFSNAQGNNFQGLQFSVSYFGVLGTHPGLKIGLQYPLANIGGTQAEE